MCATCAAARAPGGARACRWTSPVGEIQKAAATYRVVVHLTEGDPARQEAALRNITNLLTDLGPAQTEVVLVTHGPGVSALTGETGLAGQVARLAAQGVTLAACQNTLQARGLDSGALLPHVAVVPSGIAEVVRRQHERWLYVRP